MDDKRHDSLRRNIPLDYIGTFITNLNMQNSVWVLYLAFCGLDLAQIGLCEGIYHATSIVCEIPSGAAADLLGRKRSMLLGRICVAVSCIIMVYARSFGLFAVSFIIQALGNDLNSGSEEALVYDSMKALGQEGRYVSVSGRLNMTIEVSQGIATVMGGILAEYSYFWCYSTCFVVAVLAIVPVALMTEAPYADGDRKKASVIQVTADHFRTSFAILRSDIKILQIVGYYSVVFASETLLFFYSQQYYHEAGADKIQISLILLAVGLASCAGAVASEWIVQRVGRRIAYVAAAVIAAALICYSFDNMPMSVAAFAIAGSFASMLYPVRSDALNRRIPSQQRATLISVDSMCFSVAMIVLFPAAGLMADRWGLSPVFGGIGLGLLAFVSGCWCKDRGVSKVLFHKRSEKKTYDSAEKKPVLRCSICTGEQVAGFKDLHTGKFEEVTVIRSKQELSDFMALYGIETIEKEY